MNENNNQSGDQNPTQNNTQNSNQNPQNTPVSNQNTTATTDSTEDEFGIGAELETKRDFHFPKGGIYSGYLTKVTSERPVNKQDASNPHITLNFHFTDAEGRKYKRTEWALKKDDPKFAAKRTAMNVRIKHIYEAFQVVGVNGLGKGATGWEDFFNKIAASFNTDRGGKPIFTVENGEKTGYVPIYFKLVYDDRNELGIPYSPNFIEKNTGKATLLTINPKYDNIEPPAKKAASTIPGVIGNGDVAGEVKDFEF